MASPYLPPERAGGCAYCFDPDSDRLRASFAHVRGGGGEPVRSVDLAADLRVLRELLEAGCASYAELLSHPRFDAEDFFARWEANLRAGEGFVDVDMGILAPFRVLCELVPNRHLSIFGTGSEGRHLGGRHPRHPRRPAYEWRVDGGTAIITLRTFRIGDPQTAVSLEQFVGDYDQHRRYPRLRFDLRGNGGGDMRPIRRWLAQACAADWHSYPTIEMLGALAPSKAWNRTIDWQLRNGTIDTQAAADERALLAAQWPSLAAAPRLRRHSGRRPGNGTSPYDGQVQVLVDRHTGSSGELAAYELKRALNATLVGEPTAGAAEYGEVIRYLLPTTGLIVTIPTKRMLLGCPVEGVGLPIDIPATNGWS
jgi:hypothetical protein